jgi:hypothetical protein
MNDKLDNLPTPAARKQRSSWLFGPAICLASFCTFLILFSKLKEKLECFLL